MKKLFSSVLAAINVMAILLYSNGRAAGLLDGQLWFIANGGPTDAVTGHVNTDGGNITQAGQQNSSDQSQTCAIDLAAGFYFTISNDHLTLEARSITNPAVVVSSVKIGNDLNTPSTADDDIVNALVLDPFTHTIYVGLWGQDAAHTGIVVVNYNTATGALDPNAAYGSGGVYDGNTTYLITSTSTGGKITDPRDFAIDTTNHKLYWTDCDNGYNVSPFVPVENISVVTYNAPTPSTTVTQLTSNAQFPANESNGIIGPIALDVAKGLIYFEVNHIGNSAATLWWVPTSGGTATTAALPAGSALGFGDVPQGGISIDPQSQNIFITVQSGTAFAGPDEILQGGLSADGHTITNWINTNSLAALDGHTPAANAHVADTQFDQLPTLSVTGTATHAAEQGGFVDLTTSNTSSDTDGDHYSSATVQITGGTFSSNENSTNDDHLSVLDSATHRTNGVFTGTSITVAYDSSGEKLTLSGYDTIAHYNTVLATVEYHTTGDNPSNYGSNTTRTLSWTISDGVTNIPFGAQNSAATTLTIDTVNDAPTNTVPGAQTATEDTAKSISGISVSDVDADPANQNITLTLAVTLGKITVRTDVASGLTAGGVSGNASASVILTGTQNAINTTLAAANGVVYLGNTNFYGSDTLTVTANDQGHTGTGGVLQDQDSVAITVNPVPDTPSVTGATTSEDTQTSSGLVISRNPADGAEVTSFKITGITGGSLFQNDGSTTITNNQFITFAQASAGLKFLPATNAFSPGTSFGFSVQASLSASDAGLGGSIAPATITVNPVADTPSVTGATTQEGQQTASGLVISRNPADGAEVTSFKITGIQNGTLYQNNGTTQIINGSFITFAQANAGLKFTPTPVLYSPGSSFGFSVQASTNAADVGLGGGIVSATVTVNPNYDFGDAPAPYPTLLANDGARHITPSTGATLFLGSVPPDIDTNGQPNVTATGDGSDEDGVTFPAAFTNSLPASLTVVASLPGKLDAWIDFNRDGDWNDAGEQIFTNRSVVAGPNVLTFTVPNIPVSTNSFARFRLSSAGNLAPTGQAADGEVEDYQVQLFATFPPQISCPSDITTNAAGYCPPAVAFASTAIGIPTPVVSYKLGNNAITSPYAFPVGTNTVTSTATNSVGTNTCSFKVIVAPGAAPQLSVVRSGTNVVISWTNLFPCYMLQFTPVLASNTWSTYPGPFVTNGGKIYVTNGVAVTNRFFRLFF